MRLIACLAITGGLFAADLSPTEYLDYVKYLASDQMKGRATGSPELNQAADYIASKFRSMHLQPLKGASYFQDFEVTTSAKLGPHNGMRVGGGTLTLQQDFVPLNLSSSGKVTGDLVFAGYGITAPEY